jgi:hypothetical protein
MKTLAKPDDLAQLVARLKRLEPDTPRRWGTLSAREMLCHLADVGESVLAGGVVEGGRSRPIFKAIWLKTGLPWPHGVKTNAKVDPRRDGSKPGELDADRQRVVDGLHRLAAAEKVEDFPPAHSVFGTLSVAEWHRWGWKHTDHHLRQFGL